MSPDAGQHAALIFIAVFGGAAIWFGAYIAMTKWAEGKPFAISQGRVVGLPGAIGAVVFIGVVLSFWR
jgi:hypothetical protein